MANKQTRRSFSVRTTTHQRLHLHLQQHDPAVSLSAWIEALVTEHLDAAGVPIPSTVKPCKRKPELPPPKIGSGICEF